VGRGGGQRDTTCCRSSKTSNSVGKPVSEDPQALQQPPHTQKISFSFSSSGKHEKELQKKQKTKGETGVGVGGWGVSWRDSWTSFPDTAII